MRQKRHIQMLVYWLLFLGFHTVTTGNVFLCLTMIQNRKNIKTLGNLINTRYKSDSLVFRCSLYCLFHTVIEYTQYEFNSCLHLFNSYTTVGYIYILEQEILHSLFSTGLFQERIRKCVYKLIASYTVKLK
jgi:hypothetical protein